MRIVYTHIYIYLHIRKNKKKPTECLCMCVCVYGLNEPCEPAGHPPQYNIILYCYNVWWVAGWFMECPKNVDPTDHNRLDSKVHSIHEIASFRPHSHIIRYNIETDINLRISYMVAYFHR